VLRDGKLFRKISPRTKTEKSSKPLVWLHIGFGKTGTTALQKYFVARSKVDPHFFYPALGRVESGAHHAAFPLFMQKKAMEAAPQILKQLRTRIFEQAPSTVTVLSSEHLCFFRPSQVAALAKVLEGCNVRILFFARPQCDLIESTFKWNIVENSNRHENIAAFIETEVRAFDFMLRIKSWREHFDDSAISAHLYHKETCATDIVAATLKVLELEPIQIPESPRVHRVSLGVQLTRVLAEYNQLHSGPGKRKLFIDGLREIESLSDGETEAPFVTPELRLHIQDRYAASNAEFGRLFLSEMEADLLSRKA